MSAIQARMQARLELLAALVLAYRVPQRIEQGTLKALWLPKNDLIALFGGAFVVSFVRWQVGIEQEQASVIVLALVLANGVGDDVAR